MHPLCNHMKNIIRLLKWPNWEQRRKLLEIEIWIFIGISYLLLCLITLWSHNFESDDGLILLISWGVFLLRTFSFHFGLVFILIGIIAAIFKQWKMVLVLSPLLLIFLINFLPVYFPRSRHCIDGEHIKIMSMNLLMINTQREPIINEIITENPDILLLQEYTDEWHETIYKKISTTYPHSDWVCRNDSFGVAIYSKKEFVKLIDRYIPLGDQSLPEMRATIRLNGKEVVLYNLHLLPPRQFDYTRWHQKQFTALLKFLSSENKPVILTGDLNFTEQSSFHNTLKKIGLSEGHELASSGRGSTWINLTLLKYLPGIRLDHIYLSQHLTCIEHRLGIGKGSDHRPIIAVVGFRGVAR